MKICIDCGRQLFDRDNSCDKCNSKNIISEEEYNKIIEELEHANIFTKKKLLQNQNYKCIYDRLQQPKVFYPKPIILENSNYKSDEEYWKRINQHTINKNTLLSQTVECPYCHSNDTKKITTTSKVVNTVVWGIFGTKRHKQWHCNKCNSDF
jgi:hypothetical protein